jgi:predicted N-acetyltransferase YhbS
MRIDLVDPPQQPQFPDGIAIRSMRREQDEHEVWQVVEESFADHWGYAPMPFDEFMYYRIEGQPHFDPSLVFTAHDDADIAGVAICLPAAAGRSDTGWVSVLGVRPTQRGRGIGMGLLRHAFSEFHRRGYTGVGLNVDGSSLTGADRLYERAGMHEVRRASYFDKALR